MKLTTRSCTLGANILPLLLSLALSLPLPASVLGANTAEKPTQSVVVERPLSDSILRAVLWMRLSAEYEALCRQVYANALERVRNRLAAGKAGKPPAVILDLDETVLDNAGYQAHLTLGRSSHSQDRWQQWQKANVDKVGLVPGAKEFIKEVEKAGVHVVFITNRSTTIRDATIEVLVRQGVATRADLAQPSTLKLLMRSDNPSKESRRQQIYARYTVLANVGDNLNDFADDFGPRVPGAERRASVTRYTDKWGADWFVLPNPIYGYWLRSIDWDHVEQYFGATNP